MHDKVTYLHKTEGMQMMGVGNEGATWYFTTGPAHDGTEMEVFTIEGGVICSDPEVDRHIHGHPEKNLRGMFRPINTVVSVT